MSIFEPLAIIFSPSTSWRTRIIYFIIVLTLAFWIDSQMGFTYHFFTSRKIEEISSYNQILKDSLLDSGTRKLIEKERLSVIIKSRAIVEPISRHEKVNSPLFHVSYSWIYLILVIFGIPLLKRSEPYATKREIQSQWWSMFAAIILLIVLNFFIARGISTYLAGTGLYIANTLLQIGFLLMVIFITSSKK